MLSYPARRGLAIGAAVLLAVHCGLLAWQARGDSATWDEVGHFAAGVSHWRNGDFALYRVNPPLVRVVAAAPVVLLEPKLGVEGYTPNMPEANPFTRAEFDCGRVMAESLGARYFRLLTFSRWAVIPFSILGGWVCYLWASELFGGAAGLLATAMWTICPGALAYGHLIVPDTGAAALGAAAAYLFWRWLKRPGGWRAMATGAVLGLALLTKTTWLMLFGLWPVSWLVFRLLQTGGARVRWFCREALQLGAMLVLAIAVMNLAYGFEGSLRPLGSFVFASRALTGAPVAKAADAPPVAGNRFANTWLGRIPVPVPSSYLRGIDFVKWEFERKYWSYLNGEWRLGGWWYYYLYAMLVKEPLGTWGMALLAAGTVAWRRRTYAAPLRDELLLVIPMAAVVAMVSSQTGFNHHVRYVLPAFPFLFILISRVGRSFELGHGKLAATVSLLLGWSAFGSLSVVPHSMSYFNELAGGPKGGHYHLGNSNADWGQDLLYLRDWHERHPEARPLHVGYDLPLIDPKVLGIAWLPMPVAPPSNEAIGQPPDELGPLPGWYAVSVNWLHDGHRRYEYLNDLVPADWVGYTMPVYHISPEEADALRHKYGMPPLPSRPQPTRPTATPPTISVPAATVPVTRGGA